MSRIISFMALIATILSRTPSDALSSVSSRRGVLASAAAAAMAGVTSKSLAEEAAGGNVTMYSTPSGLKYIELKPGDGPSPRYGQLLSIKYTGYIKLPDKDKQKFDSAVFLIKHGNGRTVAGLDEGLHTMQVGGIRRLILPAKLGYVESGLGPIPESPLARFKLGSLLDDMVAVRGGNVVFDVELRSILDDEADQGYYEDASLTPEQFDTLRMNLQRKAADAQRARGEAPSVQPPSAV